ncbi:MAG: hypothetical protein GY869_09090, partial [Planctomycetes bacterium]|nr:hypothetical protein [Planctomycetota bacterium]
MASQISKCKGHTSDIIEPHLIRRKIILKDKKLWRFGIVFLLMLALLPSTPAQAQFTWDGQFNGQWDFVSGPFTNWAPEGVPGSSHMVAFGGGFSTPNTTVDLNGSRTVLSAYFADFFPVGQADFRLDSSISSTDVFTLVNGDITATGMGTHKINVNLSLSNHGDWLIDNPLMEVNRIVNTGNKRIRKTGTGTVSFAGGDEFTQSSIYSIQSNEGAVLIDGAHINLTSTVFGSGDGALEVEGGDVTIQNGAVVQGDSSYTLVKQATLTITGNGSSFSGKNLNTYAGSDVIVENEASLAVAADSEFGWSGSSDLIIQSGATADFKDLFLGISASCSALITGANSQLDCSDMELSWGLGSVGTLTVDDGGAIVVRGRTRMPVAGSSITIDGGTFETSWLTGGSATAISISDPAGDGALTIGHSGTENGNYKGPIDDAAGSAGSLRKISTNMQTLEGANTYTGGTIIDGGTLRANNTTGSATGTGPVTVNSSGTLSGTGSAGGTVAVSSGGTVAPGASAGILTVDDVVFEGGSTLAIELIGNSGVAGTDFDQLVVSGTATINGGSLDLSYVDPFTAVPGDSFVLLTAGTLTGTFDTVNYPDAQGWSIDYDPVSGKVTVGVDDVVENAAPTITSGNTASVDENQTSAIDVQANDDSDSEGSGLTFSLTGSTDDALFNIDANSGVVTFLNAPDFEAPADNGGDNDYDIQVTVTDSGGLTAVQ